jgi:hypothetical protein
MWFDGGQNPVNFCSTQMYDRFNTASGSTTLHFSSCNPQGSDCGCQSTAVCSKTASWSGC